MKSATHSVAGTDVLPDAPDADATLKEYEEAIREHQEERRARGWDPAEAKKEVELRRKAVLKFVDQEKRAAKQRVVALADKDGPLYRSSKIDPNRSWQK